MNPMYIHSYKVRIRILLTILILLIVTWLFHVSAQSSPFIGMQRPSITFILGEDEDAGNPYYSLATSYYQNNPEGCTNYLVCDCRSLSDVRDYLANNYSDDGQPWGLINLVSHGNQWLGLSVKVTPQSKRATCDRILENIRNGKLKELPDSLIDSKTEIFLHGCGVGNNPGLVDAVGEAFGGSTNKPKVRASKLFEYYSLDDGAAKEIRRYFAHTWSICYKMGENLEKDTLCDLLGEKYPTSEIDWINALNRELPRWSGDIYYYTFEVPVKFTIKQCDINAMPNVNDEDSLMVWVKNQKEITGLLEKIEIPAEKFKWSVTTVYANEGKGKKSPALWIKGYCTVMCIIEPLVGGDRNECERRKPYAPELDDPEYYYVN